MSGSGGGTPPPPPTRCDKIFDETPLNSVDAAVLKHVKVADVLEVILKKNPGGAKPSVVAVTRKPKVAIVGAITSAITPLLIRCIEDEGFEYVAVVKKIHGGQCIVEVRPASQ